jgi:hypothetical protein
MQRMRNKRQLILLAILVASTLLAFWWVQPENRIPVDQDAFRVPDLKAISKVELVSDSGTVTLSFNGGHWTVNGDDADGNMINVLFATLQQARPRRMVGHTRRDSIYQVLVKHGVQVSLYEGNQLTKTFIAGGNAAKTQAFFADAVTQDVYVMAIPGYRVYVSGIFEMRESGWWDKLVFGFNWATFKSLKAEFPRTPSENFTVAMLRNRFGVEGIAETDTARLNTFLDDVSLLAVDEYVSEPGLKDSLLAMQPLMHITVADVGNRTYDLKLFVPEAPSRISGVVQDSRVAFFSRRKVHSLLKSKSFFKKK